MCETHALLPPAARRIPQNHFPSGRGANGQAESHPLDALVQRCTPPLFLVVLALAGWPAGYALAQDEPSPAVLVGHSAAVNSAIYTANQRFVVTAGADQVIKLWDAKTGKEVRILGGHTAQVLSLASSPDSASIVSGAGDNTLRLWDVPRPDPLRVFPGHTAAVRAVATSPNGQWAVSFGDDKTGRVWRLEDGSLTVLLEGHAAEALVAAVRADNNQIASGDAAGDIHLWGPLDGQSQGVLGAHVGPLRGLAFHPNNQQLVSAGEDGLWKVWQLPVTPPRLLAGHSSPVRAVAISGNGQLAVTGSDDSVRVFNVTNGQPVRELAGAAGATAAIAVSGNSTLAAAAGEAGVIKFWNLADGADRLQIAGHATPVHALAFHPDNQRIASGDEDGTIRLWRLPIAPIAVSGHTADVVSVTVSPNGQLAATASVDKSVRLWNPTTGQAVRQLNGHQQPLSRVAFRGDGGQLASGDAAGEVQLWNAADGASQGTIGAHAGPLRGLAIQPAGDQLATVGEDGCLKIWRLPVATPQALAGNTEAVAAVALSSDAKIAVTGGADKSVRFFDAQSGQPTRALADVPEAVTALALSPDDAITAVGSANGVIKFYNTADGTPWQGTPPAQPDAQAPAAVSELHGHQGAVVRLVFDAASQEIISAGADGSIRRWRLPAPPEVIDDEKGAASKFVVSPDGKRCATAGLWQDRPAILVRDLASGKITHTLLGHEGAISALAFHREGTRLASGGADNTARVWDLNDQKFPELQKVLHASAVSAVALGEDATQLFTAAGDNVIRCWSVAEAEELQKLAGHGGAISSLAVAGQTLFSASADGTVRLWNLQNAAPLRSISHAAAVTSLAVTADGSMIASGGADQTVKLWNASDGAAVATLPGHAAAIVDLRFSADGFRLASTAQDGLRLWDVAGQRRLESFALAPLETRGVGFSGQRLAVGIADGSLRLVTPQLVQLIDAHADGVTSIARTPDGKRIVSSGADKTLKLWSLADGSPMGTLAGPTDVVTSVSVTADGQRVVAGGLDKTLRVWSLPAAAATQPVMPEQQWELAAAIRSIRLSADGKRAAVGGDDQLLSVWDLVLGCELQRFSGHTAAVSTVALSADGSLVLSGGADKMARLSRVDLSHVALLAEQPTDVEFLADGTQLLVATAAPHLESWKLDETTLEAARRFPAEGAKPPGFVPAAQVALAVRPDGAQVASLDQKGRLHVWNVADGTLSYAVDPSGGAASAPPKDAAVPGGGLRFSADNSLLAVGQGEELRVLAADSGRLLQQFSEPSPVADVAFAPDHRTLWVGRTGQQNQAAVRQLSLERLIDAHQGAVHGLAFTPDGNGLLSGGADGQTRLWNVADGTPRRSYAGSEAAVTSLAVTKDAKLVVAGSLDKNVRVWPLSPPASAAPSAAETPNDVAPQQKFPFDSAVRGLSVSADNLKLAVCGDDGVVRVLDLAGGVELQRFAEHQQTALAVAFAADNKTLVSGGADQSARVCALALLRATVGEDDGPLADLALANAGAQAVTAGKSGIKQWNLSDGNLLRQFEGGKEEYQALAVRNDNTQLIAADVAQNVYFWNLANGQLTTSFKAPAAVQQLRYSPDNQKIVAACADNRLRFYDPAEGSLTYELNSETPLAGVTFSTDNRTVFSGGEQLSQWLYASPTAIRTITGHGGRVYAVAYSPDGRWIASASADQTVRIWNADTGAQAKQLSGHQGPVYSVAFSPDGALLASCGADKSVRLWDTLGGRQLKQIPVGDSTLYSVAFLADGKRVAAAGLDRKVFLVDALAGQVLNTLDKHPDFLYRVALNRQGTRLLSCGYGGHIMVWNAANGQQLHAAKIDQVANFADFAPDGARIVVAGGDGNTYLLDLPANAR